MGRRRRKFENGGGSSRGVRLKRLLRTWLDILGARYGLLRLAGDFFQNGFKEKLMEQSSK